MPRAKTILWPIFAMRTVSQNEGSTLSTALPSGLPSTLTAFIISRSPSNSCCKISLYCSMPPGAVVEAQQPALQLCGPHGGARGRRRRRWRRPSHTLASIRESRRRCVRW
eukprot:SRR837773.11477.p4 GENE.SRR837773.11477~~SRR837773.11477.p4  ORF type:complete len:110 (-),score=3.51 SRR837773.11477:273-602(-)